MKRRKTNACNPSLLAFGMSGLMVTEELKKIENKFSLDLGHTPRLADRSPVEYYPQFEQDIRSEAATMAHHYELFYCLEQSIRKLITETLHEAFGTAWWTSGNIPQDIVDEVSKRIEREKDSGMSRRSDAEIDYTTFGELSIIISKNWAVFGTIFTSSRAVEKIMSNLNNLRGPIAHCCPLSEDEADRLALTVKDWFRIIG